MIEIVQSDSYEHDIYSKKIPLFDASWSGTWAIVDLVDPAPVILATGPIQPSPDNTVMEIRIPMTSTTTLAVKNYLLVARVSHVSSGFSKEVFRETVSVTEKII